MRMILIAGGWSTEREVSLSGARKIEQALKALGHEVRFLDPAKEFADIVPAASKADFAFINLHGSPGEDGLIQALLETAGCPYQGAGPKASFLALNKAATKSVYTRFGLPTPDWRLYCGLPGEDQTCDLPYPLFVKPNTGGSSVGMSLVREPADFGAALAKVFALGQEALVETCVTGVELTCAVLDQTPLPVIMIRPKSGSAFFDYENKYAADGAEEICPAPVAPELAAEVQRLALAAHRALGIDGYSRTDFMVGGPMAGEIGPQLLETNTLPGMTPTSLLPRAAAAVGLTFEELVSELVRLGLETHSLRMGK
ncbi:MAG: D-alanine--D-alanine ligase [Deltaproteobacteria bacterium HGW-Deltaproteobacteria-8]|jgi:D-alanine-D-alanine ligase|nr:MAG: D-alanine--D-alanine ligase [Deltaproteobacteria bacterium HGW-Deltaproteobacteria-8]